MSHWNNGVHIWPVILILLKVTTCQNSTQGQIKLSLQNVDVSRITVSGFSSGGTMAQMMQVAHSSLFSGLAVFSHAFYRCGLGNGDPIGFDDLCTTIGPKSATTKPYDPRLSIAEIMDYSAQQLIDDPMNLRVTPLYVFTGTKSPLFPTATSLGILTVFEPFIQNSSLIRTRVQVAELVLPSNSYGGPCGFSASSTFYIANCGFNGAYDALNFILGGGLKEPKVSKLPNLSRLYPYDQSEFFPEKNVRHDMDSEGYIYIPEKCEKGKKCLLHFYFHGCRSGREFFGTNHITYSGYLQVAEANDIIVVFPQVLKNDKDNTWACWDTYGYTGQLYATKRGGQVRVVRNMLERLTENQKPNYNYTK